MQKTILKQQYKNFAASRSERLDKTYDRFQKLISQLEIHGEVISQEYANLKLLKSLPSAWNNIALIIRNKSDLDTISMDDLYNNLKVYEAEIKGQSSSSSNSQNVTFVSSENTSSTNEAVNTAHEVSTASSQGQASSSTYSDDVMAPRNQGNINGDAPRRIVPVETLANTLVVQDGICGASSSSSSNTKVRDNSITELKNQLAKALREKDDLKLKLEKFETSSMKLTKLINSQISVNNKSGVGFDSQMNENELHDCHLNKSEVFESASDSSVNEIEEENNQVNDRFKKVEGYHAVPPPYTGNYMPSRPDLSFAGLDDSVYKTNVSETISSVPRIESTASKSSKDSLEQPKDVRPSAPIIEEWESDSDDDCVIRPSFEQNKPSYAKINFVKSDENTRKSVIEQHTYRQAENLRKRLLVKGKLDSFGTIAQRVNHQNKFTHPHLKRNFVPTAVVTKSGQVPVNTAKQSSYRAAASISTARHVNTVALKQKGNPQYALQDQGIFDSGCSRHMTGNKSYLTDYQDIDGGFVAFAGSPKRGKITRKGKIRTGKLDFKDVYFVKELKFNLFSVSQMCDKKNNVLFTKTECLVLSPDFKLLDESQVLLKVPRQNNMYSFDLKNVVPSGGLTCLFAKATIDESNLWHRRLGYINFKTMNKLVRGNLVRGIETIVNAGSIDNKDADEVPGKGDDDLSERNGQEKEEGVSNKEDDQHVKDFRAELDNLLVQQKEGFANNTNRVSTVNDNADDQERIDSSTQDVNTVGPSINTVSENINTGSINMNTASPIPNDSSMQSLEATGIFSSAYDDEDVGVEADLNNLEITMNLHQKAEENKSQRLSKLLICLFSLINRTQEGDSSFDRSQVIEKHGRGASAKFKLQKLDLVDFQMGKRAIGTKWVYRNKKDKRGIVVRNKARLVTQGYTQEEGINYDEVFAPVARIEAIRLFLAYASFMGLIVYQMDVKSAFLYGTIEEEVYVCQPPSFEDPQFPNKVYKVEKALYGLHQAPRAWYETLSTYLLENGYIRGTIDKILFIKKDRGDIVLVQVFQVTPNSSHLYAVKMIFRYLKGQPKLGLWYPRDSPFDLEAFSDSDYARASLDMKSTIGDEFVYKELDDKMERAATTASSLEAEQDNGNINRIQSMAKLNESFPQGTDSGSGPKCQDTILGGEET
ncbi:putative ribonuclease H-like domain-containing protein [Tanacetum coccineum]